MKIFEKAVNKDGEGFKYLRRVFPQLTDATGRGKEDIFIRPQLIKSLIDFNFTEKLSMKI